ENGRIMGSVTGVQTASVADKIWLIFQALGDVAFSYPYSILLLEIQDTLESPPPENQTMKKASMIAIFITTFFYLCCGCFGYAAFGDATPGNLLTGFGFYEPFWLIDLANVCIIIHLVGGYQKKVGAWTRKWIVLRIFSFACFLVTMVGFIGSFEVQFKTSLAMKAIMNAEKRAGVDYASAYAEPGLAPEGLNMGQQRLAANQIVHSGLRLWMECQAAKNIGGTDTTAGNRTEVMHNEEQKEYQCNVDASFLQAKRLTCYGGCLQQRNGAFIQAVTEAEGYGGLAVLMLIWFDFGVTVMSAPKHALIAPEAHMTLGLLSNLHSGATLEHK
ncbi:amino acid permease, partial [Trifolium pratense]